MSYVSTCKSPGGGTLCAHSHTLGGSEIYLNRKSFRFLNAQADDRVFWQDIRGGFADVNGVLEEPLQELFTFLRSLP